MITMKNLIILSIAPFVMILAILTLLTGIVMILNMLIDSIKEFKRHF